MCIRDSHWSIVAWDLGSELDALPEEFRDRMVRLIQGLTGCEMVGGYADQAFEEHSFSANDSETELIKAAARAATRRIPVILDRFAEIETHRDLPKVADSGFYWTSASREFNAPGLRQQVTLPRLIRTSDYSLEPLEFRHWDFLAQSVTTLSLIHISEPTRPY